MHKKRESGVFIKDFDYALHVKARAPDRVEDAIGRETAAPVQVVHRTKRVFRPSMSYHSSFVDRKF